MKELSIEQKAKAYDIALDKIKRLLGTGSNCSREELEYVFPELKESEDERIREVLIGWINLEPSTSFSDTFDGFSKEQILAWLEKKGNKPQVRTGLEWCNTIDDACDKRYAEEYADGEYCHEQSFKWGFQEGVEWREKQGENHIVESHEMVNPAWSEEDEKMRKSLIASLSRISANTRTDSTSVNCTFIREINWLKSLCPQKHWKPSETAINILEGVINGKINPQNFQATLQNIIVQLKAL